MANRPRVVLISIMAVLAILLAAAPVIAGVSGPGVVSSALGPQLLLISAAPGQLAALSAPPFTLHAVVGDAQTNQYIASGAKQALAYAEAHSFAARLLDANTRGKVYYFLDTVAEGARAAAQRVGAIVYTDDTVLLLAVPVIRERSALDALSAGGIHVQLLSGAAIHLQERVLSVALVRPSTGANPDIAALLPAVTADKLSTLIAKLSGEQPVIVPDGRVTLLTRYTFSIGVTNARNYIHEYFRSLNLQVADVGWTYGRYSGSNVIADLPGVRNPNNIWLIGGHFDNTSQSPYTRAPGADDNASGVAAMMLIADILRHYQFSDTIRFVAFSGEEQGMWGSKSYASRLNSAGAQVMGYIDLDMIGWDGNGDRVIELHSGTRANSVALANAFIDANVRYGTGLTAELKQGSASRFSDHSSFWDQGYPAFMAIENFFADSRAADRNPYYHNTGDLLSRVRLDYVARYTRAALATVAELAGMGAPPAATPTASATPEATATATATVTPTPGAATCSDILVNGDMETQAGWAIGSTPRRSAYATTPVFSGARSLYLGNAPALRDVRSYSSAYQRLRIPANATAVLTAQVWRGTQDSAGDRQEMLLLTPAYRLLRVLQRGLATDRSWQPWRFDLSGYAGQDVVIYVNTYNDGDGRRSWMAVDDMRLTVCTRP